MMYNESMKRVGIFLTILLAFLWVLPAKAIDKDSFYFEDYTADYYLTRDEEGISHLKVKERLTAVFPDYDQNKGFCRLIPFTNQDGANITLPELTRNNIKLTRNGEDEPIYSIGKTDDSETKNGYYTVCTGTEEYVHGKQVYELEYSFERVVDEFEKDGKNYQELYWDANGNGWRQRFSKVTARLHFEDEDVYDGKSWCYVGKYGSNNQSRCKVTELEDGLEFSAFGLSAFEGLTFVALLKDGSFEIVPPEKDYTFVIIMSVSLGIAILLIGFLFVKFLKSREKANYYKGIFVKPEYQPNKGHSLTEMAELYLGKKKDMKVAMLLELVVKRKIELKKQDKRKWSILVKSLNGVDGEYMDLLSILNGGSQPKEGDEIELKSRSATTTLINLKKEMDKKVVVALKKDGLVTEKYYTGDSKKRGIDNIIAMTVIIVPFMIAIVGLIMSVLEGVLGLDESYGKVFVGQEDFMRVMFIIIVASSVIGVTLEDLSVRYAKHTDEGLKASRYMDGLKLYIKMAEADRMKMLQSVRGADTSVEGIVKLYEKLLPYAAVFGLEESWIKEMKEYCKVEEIEEPDYLMSGIAASEISRGLRSASSYAAASTMMSSSGGGSSSGFSGSFGGGFSGGGGGGGGGFGR